MKINNLLNTIFDYLFSPSQKEQLEKDDIWVYERPKDEGLYWLSRRNINNKIWEKPELIELTNGYYPLANIFCFYVHWPLLYANSKSIRLDSLLHSTDCKWKKIIYPTN